MNTATTLQPKQFVVDIDDLSLINDIRRAIKMIRGVGSVRIAKPKSLNKTKSEVEEALEDAKAGRVTEWNCSVDEMFDTILKG